MTTNNPTDPINDPDVFPDSGPDIDPAEPSHDRPPTDEDRKPEDSSAPADGAVPDDPRETPPQQQV